MCIVSTNLGLRDFVVAPQRLDSASLSTSSIFLTSQEVSGLFLCIMLSHFLPLVWHLEKKQKNESVLCRWDPCAQMWCWLTPLTELWYSFNKKRLQRKELRIILTVWKYHWWGTCIPNWFLKKSDAFFFCYEQQITVKHAKCCGYVYLKRPCGSVKIWFNQSINFYS